ncbi:MAG: cell division protein ZapA [Desulfobacterales bacterium]|nr:MAG: cell division protein ZapA [Desulfobacterales bacterium]
MADEEQLVTFRLLGQNFAFYTGASEEEMDAILGLVRQQVEDSDGGDSGTLPVSKIAVMACLNLASRYVRLKKEYDLFKTDVEQQAQVLNRKIERHLGDDFEDDSSYPW